jgi:hypothetical protein
MTSRMVPPPMSPWFEQIWLERYLDGDLEEEEVAWFEAYMLDKPNLLRAVDADTALREALVAADLSVTVGSTPDDSASAPATAHLFLTRLAPALAASIVFALAGWFGHDHLSGSTDQEVISAPTRVVFDTMRGSSPEPRMERSESRSQWVIVDIAVPPGALNATLMIASEKNIVLISGPDGFATALIRRDTWRSTNRAVLRYLDGESRIERELIWTNHHE